MADRIRVVVADDHDDVRGGFRRIIDAQPDMVVAGEAADGAAVLELARHLRPDVILMDVRMPRLDGLEVTRRLMESPGTAGIRVVVVTTFDLDEYVARALEYGACGFLLKRAGPALLMEAVRAAVSGDVLISPQVTVRLLARLRSVPPGSGPDPGPLTPREAEVARAVAAGRTNAEIGRELFVSLGTVKTHIANIQAKIGARNRVGIAAWAFASGLAVPPPGAAGSPGADGYRGAAAGYPGEAR